MPPARTKQTARKSFSGIIPRRGGGGGGGGGRGMMPGDPEPVIHGESKECSFCLATIAKLAKRCRHCHAQLPLETVEGEEGFSVTTTEWTDPDTNEVTSKRVLAITDELLRTNLQSIFYDSPEVYDREPKLDLDDVFDKADEVFRAWEDWGGDDTPNNPWIKLHHWLESQVAERKAKFEEMKATGKLSFSMLNYLFPRGTPVYGYEGNHLLGTEVASTFVFKGFCSSWFIIEGQVIKSAGHEFFDHKHHFAIPSWKGLAEIDSLPVQLMTPDVEQKLKERGKRFNEIGKGHHYLEYTGNMMIRLTTYNFEWKADGRVMVDTSAFNKMNPSYYGFHNQSMGMYGSVSMSMDDVPENLWYRCWPSLGGLSFVTKKWGEVFIDQCSEVTHDERAFDRLVLPEEKKHLISALVQHHSSSGAFSDIITGKGSAVTFLLHGPPGTGKTLTAEAIAEKLHRPLYAVSIGELGTNAVELEKILSSVLEVVAKWDAVVLLDEADIFLERRTESEIDRNALVGIFLRLLEYHQGVLFLTTNRVNQFDEAFHSRISVALRYPPLDKDSRKMVWTNLLDAAGIEGLDVDTLSESRINGRQIRSCIRLAQAIAKQTSSAVKQEHVNSTIGVTLQFDEELVHGENFV